MKWAVRIIQGLLAFAFFFSGVAKLSGNAEQAQGFTEVFHYPLFFMYIVGLVEVAAALGLILGFKLRRAAVLASAVLAVTMAGAVVTHLQAGQGIGSAGAALVLLVLSAVVWWGQSRIPERA